MNGNVFPFFIESPIEMVIFGFYLIIRFAQYICTDSAGLSTDVWDNPRFLKKHTQPSAENKKEMPCAVSLIGF